MKAWLLHRPLLKKEAMEREIKSVESEFQSNFVSDYARMEQLLCEHTKSKSHFMNCFAWGNLKSLMDEDTDALWNDLN